MKRYIILLGLIAVFSACKKKKSSPKENEIVAPSEAILTLPGANSVCLEGAVVNSTTSTVKFTWQKANNADSYEIVVKNLENSTSTTKTTTATQIDIDLDRNAPYSWQVTSISATSDQTAVSQLRKFYTAGVANVSHAPFAADNLQPALRQDVSATEGKITLAWDAQDVDNDLKNFDIYLGTTTNNLQIIKSNHAEKNLPDVPVNSGTTYYWKVIVRDQVGNTSSTGIYNFMVH